MKKEIFRLLNSKLTSKLADLSDGCIIYAGVKIIIYLSIMRGNTYRNTAMARQQGYWQISKIIGSILRSHVDIWGLPVEIPVLSDSIREKPSFDGCLLALVDVRKSSPTITKLKVIKREKDVTLPQWNVNNSLLSEIIEEVKWKGLQMIATPKNSSSAAVLQCSFLLPRTGRRKELHWIRSRHGVFNLIITQLWIFSCLLKWQSPHR